MSIVASDAECSDLIVTAQHCNKVVSSCAPSIKMHDGARVRHRRGQLRGEGGFPCARSAAQQQVTARGNPSSCELLRISTELSDSGA